MTESANNYIPQQIKELKDTLKTLEKRVATIEISREKTEFQYGEIMKALDKLNDTTIPGLLKQIEELKSKPVKRYDQAISGILGAIFGAIGAFIASKFLGK